MKRFSCGRISLSAMVLTLVCMAVPAASASRSDFKAGFAERDISPTIGMEQPGGYGKAYHRSFHDPCKARAAVFDDGKTRVAIVGIDALFIRRPTVLSIRTAIQKKCGIEPPSILISASHTHSGGPIGYYLPGEFDDASALVRSLIYDRTVCANPDYLTRVEQAIVEAVCAADAKKSRGAGGPGVRFRRQSRVQSPVPDERRNYYDPPRPGQSEHHRARGAHRSPGRRARRLEYGRSVAGVHRQLRVSCHDRAGRDLG